MKYFVIICAFLLMLISCANPEARKPLVRKTSSFMSESIERNKLLYKVEEEILMKKMESDTLHQYINSESGFWYYYDTELPAETYTPKTGDEVFYSHEISSLDDVVIYSKDAMGTKSFLIDKEELITGLQDGFKIMKEGEVITFLFPSHKAFGYSGYDKINPSQPLIYKVQLLKINKLSENEN